MPSGFMMLAAAVQEQVPNLNLSSVMNFMNMEVDDLSSIHDNTTGKNPSSASLVRVTIRTHFQETKQLSVRLPTNQAQVVLILQFLLEKKSCSKIFGSPLTNTVNKSDASRLNTSETIKRHEELSHTRTAKTKLLFSFFYLSYV